MAKRDSKDVRSRMDLAQEHEVVQQLMQANQSRTPTVAELLLVVSTAAAENEVPSFRVARAAAVAAPAPRLLRESQTTTIHRRDSRGGGERETDSRQ